MTRDQAYLEAEKKIEAVRISGATELNLRDIRLTELPEALGKLTQLQSLNLEKNQLRELPEWLQNLAQLQALKLSDNQLTKLPEWIGSLTQLQALDLSSNQLAALPEALGALTNLQTLELFSNRLATLPGSCGQLAQLTLLDLSLNLLTQLPEQISQLTNLKDLSFSANKISIMPEWIGNLENLEALYAVHNEISILPAALGNLKQLRLLALGGTQLSCKYSYALNEISGNRLTELPLSLASLSNLKALDLRSNPLNPELAEAYKQGLDAVKLYLRLKSGPQTALNEAKLILVGADKAGKSCLADALRGEAWQERESTQGIEIQQIKVAHPDGGEITLNAWDFNGQRAYRPAHQLFFSASAVYLVVWNPHEDSQQGAVKEWIQLVKHRAPDAKILVVATHCNSEAPPPAIDRHELLDLFGRETIVDFLFVDSQPDANGERKNMEDLKLAIARVAATLPEAGRSVPKSFQAAREALQKINALSLALDEVISICRAHGMDDDIAHLFVSTSHRLGRLAHYPHNSALRDVVILRPDWFAAAFNWLLNDEATRVAGGLASLSHLAQLWSDPTRPIEAQIFLRLMEGFALSYRVVGRSVNEETDPVSLIVQLVPANRPENFVNAWGSESPKHDLQQTQICHIIDDKGKPSSAEGLFDQLIARLSQYSLGRARYNDSVHWQRGLVLDDDYNGRALLERQDNAVRIAVRAPYPGRFLAMLTDEIKYLTESFWEGLICETMVPCLNSNPCLGLFDVGKLIENKARSRHDQACPVCGEWQEIDLLLRNAPAARPVPVGETLANQTTLDKLENARQFLIKQDKKTIGRFDDLSPNQRELISKAEASYNYFMQTFAAEAKDGPRLFSVIPVDADFLKNLKQQVNQKFRVSLWCEYSQLPLFALNPEGAARGVYELELPYEWLSKAAPYLQALTAALSLILPVASAANLILDDATYKSIKTQLAFGKDSFDAIGKGSAMSRSNDAPNLSQGQIQVAKSAILRELHAFLKEKDPAFGGLVRVMDKRQKFLWAHERFAREY